jgi:hypothetical protein
MWLASKSNLCVHLIDKTNLAFNVLAGQRTQRNSSMEDWPRVKYLYGHIGALLDALRYIRFLLTILYLLHSVGVCNSTRHDSTIII